MIECSFLQEVFSWVCGQNPDRTWAPGGCALPCCQRCTGLYVGAALAAFLHLGLRPRANSRWLQIHGLFLLQMVPFGFHWVPQDAILRTISGMLFGFGVVACLLLLPASGGAKGASTSRTDERAAGTTKVYLYSAGLSMGAVLALALWGGRWAALSLFGLAVFGLGFLSALVLANLGLGLGALVLQLSRAAKRRVS